MKKQFIRQGLLPGKVLDKLPKLSKKKKEGKK